jgi:hypothetical protein
MGACMILGGVTPMGRLAARLGTGDWARRIFMAGRGSASGMPGTANR